MSIAELLKNCVSTSDSHVMCSLCLLCSGHWSRSQLQGVYSSC